MTEYRISKYNPANRIDGIYMADEWTSFGDIGKVFGNTILSQDLYLKTERAYIDCCMELMQTAQVVNLFVEQAEYYTENIQFSSTLFNEAEIRQVIAACLREQCWLKLVAKDFFIHFGYDYYMYIGSALSAETVAIIVSHHGLYCEQRPSPYSS